MRFVILGCQAGDLEDALLEAATPTPPRRAKHCFLQVAAHHGSELKKADVSAAFLQGREQQADRYVVPVHELVDALGITRGKVESVYDGMKEIGLVQCKEKSVCVEARQGNVTRNTAASVGAVSH